MDRGELALWFVSQITAGILRAIYLTLKFPMMALPISFIEFFFISGLQFLWSVRKSWSKPIHFAGSPVSVWRWNFIPFSQKRNPAVGRGVKLPVGRSGLFHAHKHPCKSPRVCCSRAGEAEGGGASQHVAVLQPEEGLRERDPAPGVPGRQLRRRRGAEAERAQLLPARPVRSR